MDADPLPEQGPSGVNDTTLIDTDDQQKSDMLNPGIGDEAAEVLASVENTTGQESCQSISDVAHEDCMDSGNKADDSMESILEDTNVRLKHRFCYDLLNVCFSSCSLSMLFIIPEHDLVKCNVLFVLSYDKHSKVNILFVL